MEVAAEHRGPWPDPRRLVERELAAYLGAASDPSVRHLTTRCPPWTVHQLTAHLAATFERFGHMLARGRSGDLRPPFARDQLSAENLRAVRDARGDPLRRLQTRATALLRAAGDITEVMPHQFGPVPVALQLLFGLNELAIHHDDVAAAAGGSYRPDDDVVAALTPVWERVLGGLPPDDDPWQRILVASGRAVR